MSLFESASLVVTPNGAKASKLYAIKPTSGAGDLSVTRATTATRVNSAGLIESVAVNVPRLDYTDSTCPSILVEPQRTNLLTYSEQFDNAFWLKLNSSVSSNSTISPDGNSTADSFLDNAINNVHAIIPVISKPTSVITYTFTVYAKLKDSGKKIMLGFDDAVAGGCDSGVFNLSTGAWDTAIGTPSASFTNPSRSFTNEGNGWYRLNFTITSNIQPQIRSNIFLANSSNQISYIGDGTGIFIWGAQLVEGSTAKDYQKTETRLNIPRLDYSNGSCPSILVEPQRTNISQFAESGTGGFQSGTVTAGTSILGLTTFKVTTNVTLFGDAPYIDSNSQYQANTTYTLSFYTDFSKSNDTSIACSFLAFFPTLGYAGISINKATKAITTFNVGGIWTLNSYEAIQISGEIYRIIATATPNATGLGASRSYINAETNGNYGEFAGVQLEAGSYATSFISKATSASVTRNADVISKTGISSLIGQTEGTMFVDFYNDGIANYNPCAISNGLYDEAVYFEQYLGIMYAVIWDSGVQQFAFNAGALSIGRHKMAIAYKTNDIVLYIDGVLKATDTSATIPTTGTLDIGYVGGNPREKSTTNLTALWKTRLTNTQLAQLTTI